MTISEEKKVKIIELYNKGVSKKDIAQLEEISYPSIRNILNTPDTEQIKEKKKEIVEKKLSEIFDYEDYTDEGVVSLVFNLKRIGMVSGRDLGQFIEDIETIFDIYHKITENPIKIFDFLLDISNNLSLLYDCIEPEKFLTMVEEYSERGMYLNEIEAHISEQKQKSNELVDSKVKELRELDNRINEERITLESFTNWNAKISKNFVESLDLKKLKKALEKIAELELGNQVLIKKGLSLELELKQSDKENENTKYQNLLFRTLIERIEEEYPNELKKIIEEVNMENDKETNNTTKEESREK